MDLLDIDDEIYNIWKENLNSKIISKYISYLSSFFIITTSSYLYYCFKN